MSLDAAYAALTAGDFAAAERLARAAPADEASSFLLARILAGSDRLAEAEALLVPLVDRNVKALQFLASLQYRRLAFEACEANLDRLIAQNPERLSAEEFRRLAKLKKRGNREDEARAVMQKALTIFPGDIQLIAARADLLDNRTKAAAELEQALGAVDPAQDHITAYLLKRITTCRAPLARAGIGLPEHGRSWNDTLEWPDPEGIERLRQTVVAHLARPRPSTGAVTDAAWIALAQRKWDIAQQLLDHVRAGRKPGGTKDDITPFSHFGTAFHAALDEIDDAALTRDLAPVHGLIVPPPSERDALFVACDPTYFQAFTLPFLTGAQNFGLHAHHGPLDVHVHLMDGPGTAWNDAVGALLELKGINVALTAENSGAGRSFSGGRIYYHAARFIRFHQELARQRRRLWLLDADARMLRDPRSLFRVLDGADLAIRTNPLAFEPSLKMMACCVGVAPSARGLAFARRTAAYIHRMKEAGSWGWGVDQMALFSAYAYMEETGAAPATRFLGADAVCLNTETTGIFQFPSGINKYFRTDDSIT